MNQLPNLALVNALRDELRDYSDNERSMFGCRVFWVQGQMAAYVTDNRICLRVGQEHAAQLLALKMGDYCKSGEPVTEPSDYFLYSAAATAESRWIKAIPLTLDFIETLEPAQPKATRARGAARR